jgi:hypothetical protein
MNINRTILIAEPHAVLAQTIAKLMSPAGDGMFTAQVYDSAKVLKYRISSGWLSDAFEHYLTNADALYTAIKPLATLAQCQELVSTGIVSTEDPHTLLTSLGLRLASPSDTYP